jgi:hypothetical protein
MTNQYGKNSRKLLGNMEWKGLNGIEDIWRHRWGWGRNHHLWLHYSEEFERGRKEYNLMKRE